MYQAKTIYAQLALETIIAVANKQNLDGIKSREIPDKMKEQLSCFVSIHLIDGSLRGCIGTIEPRQKNLYLEIISNAASASTKDSRFSPVTKDELEDLEVSVDVLSMPFLIDDIKKLDVKKFGIIVSDGGYSRGVLLPDIEGIDSVEKQIQIAKRKAGLNNYNMNDLLIYAFTSTRYY